MVKIPVRNKSKDNPYTLCFDENKKIYTVEFLDNKKVFHKIEITYEQYKAFDNFELEDVSQIHKIQRHIEHLEMNEDRINKRRVFKDENIDNAVENKIILEEIRNAINSLSEIQKRRIKMYYFDDLSQKEIAKKEHTSIRAIQYSLNLSLKKLREILKNYKN